MLELVCIELTCGRYNAFGSPNEPAQTANKSLWTPQSVMEFAMDCVVHQVQTIHLTGYDPLNFPDIFSIITTLTPWVDLWLSINVESLQNHTILEQLKQNPPQRVIFHNYQPIIPSRTLEIMANAQELQEAGIRTMVYQYVSSRISTLQPSAEAYQLLISVFDMMDIVLVPERPHHAPSVRNLSHITNSRQCLTSSCMRQCHWPVKSCVVTWDHQVNYCPLGGGTKPLKELDYRSLYEALISVDFCPCYDLHEK